MLRTFIISVLAIGIGLLASTALLEFMCQMLATRWGVLELVTALSPIVMLAIPLLVLFITQIFTYFACSSNVAITPYEALRGRARDKDTKRSKKPRKIQNQNQNSMKQNGIKRRINDFIPFQLKYPLRNLSRNRRRGILTTLAFIGTITISFALLQTESSVDKTFENYFSNQIKWDMKTQFNNFQTEESVEMFGDNFSEISIIEPYLQLGGEPVSNPELSVQLRGLIPDSKLILIDLEEGELFSNETAPEGIIASYVAKPLNLQVGDEFEFYAAAQNFSITIVGICTDLDAHISLYMTLPAIEEILGYPLINGALIEIQTPIDSEELDDLILRINEENGVQYAILKSVYENRMKQMVDSQIVIVSVMVAVAFIISFITIFVIAFISVLERSREIALQRVFGFSKLQILGQILIELSLFVIIALLVGIFIGGESLGALISEIISEFFFEVETYRDISNYTIIIAFSIGCILLSTIPGINLLRTQNLAVSIDET
jgi:ABC-type antimicrobial peptide transport system permease subunit